MGRRGSIRKTVAEGSQGEARVGQGLVTWGPPAVEDVDVHQVLQVLLQGLPVQPRQPVGTLDTLGLPVGPVDALPIEGQSKRVGQLASNQDLPGSPRLCHVMPQSGLTVQSRRQGRTPPVPPAV